jgi:uncharacterized protein
MTYQTLLAAKTVLVQLANKNMKNTVIYHRADYDGLFSREVAKKFLPKTTNFIGWDYGDPTPEVDPNDTLYMIDISVDGLMNHPNLIWIDHHISAINKYPKEIKGYRIDGVAACRLAYQWFLKQQRDAAGLAWMLPDKTEFENRAVVEPKALTLAGEYDVWVHKGDGDEELQYGLDCQSPPHWDSLLEGGSISENYVGMCLNHGKAAMACYRKRDADIVNEKGHIQEFEGLKFLTLNTAGKGSKIFAAKDKPETGHDALMLYNWNGKKWSVSLYHSNHKKDIDLSAIAAKYGGGGHKGACGFRCDKLPFQS